MIRIPAWTFRWSDLPWLAATAGGYALLAKLVLSYYSANGMVSVFWPASGLALAALLLGGPKYRAAVFIGSLAGDLWTGQSALAAAAMAVGNTLEAMLAVHLLTRDGEFDLSLRSSRDFFRLVVLGGALSPVVAASIGIGAHLAAGDIAFADAGRRLAQWWMGDALGIVFVAPLILAWRKPPRQRPESPWESLAVLALAFLAGQIIFLDRFNELFGQVNHGYWMYLFVCWAAVRLGLNEVLAILLMTIVQLLAGVAHGRGFFGDDLASTQLTNFWGYTMTLSTVGMSLAILFAERGRILAELRSSENRYSKLFANLPDALAHCRVIYRGGEPADYEYLAVNPAFASVCGLTDVVGRRIGDLIPDYARNDRDTLETFARVAATGEPAYGEKYQAALDRWFAYTAYRPAAGEFVVVFQDISQRKRAEAEVGKLSLAVAQSPASIVITDLDGCITYVNPAFTGVSGYRADEVLGRNPRLLQSDRTPPETYRQLWKKLSAGEVWAGEFINRRKDGSEYVEAATISPLRDDAGRITHYIAVKSDITERQRMISELRASEERLRLAKDAVELGIYDCDIASGRVQYDARSRDLFALPTEGAVSCDALLANVHALDRPAMQAAIDRALAPGGSGWYRAEFRVVAPETGAVRHVMNVGQVVFESGRAIRLVGTVKDTSVRKRLEVEIQERRNEMARLVNRQVAAQTAAAIAHELNQPLVSVSAYSEAALRMLRGGNRNPDKLTHALEGAVQQAQRAGSKLHELLAFLHEGETVAEPVDLSDVIRSALAIAEENGYGDFTVRLDVAPRLPPVLANRLQLQKVLVNLLHNGVEAMRGAGVTDMRFDIGVRALAGRGMAEVSLRDNGPGLPPETVGRVFDPFFTTKRDGVGLGLAISRALIVAHGGELWTDNGTARGASFHFVLPLAS